MNRLIGRLKHQWRRWSPWVRCPRRNAWLIEGESKHRKLPLKVAVFAKSKMHKAWLQSVFFAPGATCRKVGKRCEEDFMWGREVADILIGHDDDYARRYHRGLPHLTMSWWLDTEFAVDESSVANLFRTKPFREINRLIRKHGYEARVIDDSAEVRKMGGEMILPFIRWRHGESCLADEESFYSELSKCKLLQVRRDGDVVSCCAFMELADRKKIHLKKLGVRMKNGQCPDRNYGANGAVYYFMIQHCLEQGVECLTYGGSRPVVQDPVNAFKLKKAGGKVSAIDDDFMYRWLNLYFLNDSAAVRDSFVGYDIFCQDGQSYRLACFVDNERLSDERFKRHLSEYEQYGLSGIDCYNFDEPCSGTLAMKSLLI